MAGPDLEATLLGRELLPRTERFIGVMGCGFFVLEGGIEAKDWNGRLR